MGVELDLIGKTGQSRRGVADRDQLGPDFEILARGGG